MASLIGRIIHIFDRTFHVRTAAYVYLFPHFLYPFRWSVEKNISMNEIICHSFAKFGNNQCHLLIFCQNIGIFCCCIHCDSLQWGCLQFIQQQKILFVKNNVLTENLQMILFVCHNGFYWICSRSIMLAATVFMTIAVVHERWRVISRPNSSVLIQPNAVHL